MCKTISPKILMNLKINKFHLSPKNKPKRLAEWLKNNTGDSIIKVPHPTKMMKISILDKLTKEITNEETKIRKLMITIMKSLVQETPRKEEGLKGLKINQ